MDKERVEFRPLRSHVTNEIIAWQGDDQALRYGVILSPADQQGDEEGSSGGGIQEAKSAGEGLVRRLTVRTHANKVQDMLSTQVYSFRATRTGRTTSKPRQPPTPATAAVTPDTQRNLLHDNAGPRSLARASNVAGFTSDGGAASSSPTTGPPPVASDHLLDAVDEILSRVNMSLGMEKKEVMATNLKLQKDLDSAFKEVEASRSQVSTLSTELEKIKGSFQCQICYQRDVENICVPCGHMLCSQCKTSIESRRQCPFCRARLSIITPFFKPWS